MLTGLGARVMTYDGENRPLSVSYAGKQTCYVYGADGARLKKLEGYTGAGCATPGTGATVTVYLGPVEIRNFGQGNGEQLLIYAAPALRITKTKNSSGVITSKLSVLHRDGLGSVRAVTNGAGTKNERDTYRPFGEQTETVFGTAALPEAKGFIGERYDADAGLEYLNARYYDPRLGMFIQPDWWEVMQAGVGTNRYAYSFDDPVNGKDVTGHEIYDHTVSEKDKKRLEKDLQRQRNFLSNENKILEKALKGEKVKKGSPLDRLLSDIKRAQNGRPVTSKDILARMQLNYQRTSYIGNPDEGVVVSRKPVMINADGTIDYDVAATSPVNTTSAAVKKYNSVTIYDHYFEFDSERSEERRVGKECRL